jgi:hypothetical protein
VALGQVFVQALQFFPACLHSTNAISSIIRCCYNGPILAALLRDCPTPLLYLDNMITADNVVIKNTHNVASITYHYAAQHVFHRVTIGGDECQLPLHTLHSHPTHHITKNSSHQTKYNTQYLMHTQLGIFHYHVVGKWSTN